MIVPFLGTALSRAREYTCDRYGLAGVGDREGAIIGLTVLAAGGRLARRVDRRAFAAQREHLETGLMTLGEWLSTHPPLSKRLIQLDPALAPTTSSSRHAGALRAAAIVAAVTIPALLTGVTAAVLAPRLLEDAGHSRQENDYEPPPPDIADRQARFDIQRMAAFIQDEVRAGRGLPWDEDELYERWTSAHPAESEPRDPYDGLRYGYEQRGEHFQVWSSGRHRSNRKNDLIFDSRKPAGGATR